jgi:hypothetical protein
MFQALCIKKRCSRCGLHDENLQPPRMRQELRLYLVMNSCNHTPVFCAVGRSRIYWILPQLAAPIPAYSEKMESLSICFASRVVSHKNSELERFDLQYDYDSSI